MPRATFRYPGARARAAGPDNGEISVADTVVETSFDAVVYTKMTVPLGQVREEVILTARLMTRIPAATPFASIDSANR